VCLLKNLGEDCQYTRYSEVRCKPHTHTHIQRGRERGEREGGEREEGREREKERERGGEKERTE